MSQRASAPRPASHHRSSSDVKPIVASPRASTSPRTGAARPSSNRSQDRDPRRLLHRDEHHGMPPAGPGDSSGDQYTARYNNDDTTTDSRPNINANSPRGIVGVTGPSAIPRTITGSMATEREAGAMDNTPTSTMPPAATAAAAAALAANNDDRPSATTASSRTFGVHNILNPSEAQQTMAHSPSMVPRTASRGNSSMDSGESRPLPRTRPSSASSPRIGSASSASTSHLGRAQPGHAPPPFGFIGSTSGSTNRLHGSPRFASANYSQGYGQPASAADMSQQSSTTLSPGMGFVPLSGAAGSDHESSPQPGYAHTSSSTSFGPPPRRILTPKSPRRSSLGRPIPGVGVSGSQHPLFPRDAETPPVPPLPPTALHQSMSAPNVGLGFGPRTSPGHTSGSAQVAGSVPGSYFPPHVASGHPSSMVPGESPQRSISQPYYTQDAGGHGDGHGSHGHTPEAQPVAPAGRDAHRHQQTQQQQDQQPPRFPFPTGHRPQGEYAGNTTQPSRIASASSASTGSGEGSWNHQGAVGGAGGGRSMSMSEGQQFITITPSFGEEIHVPVDVHQASKQADEKRLRNAGASARFRARKKEKDKEAQLGIQRLESMNREIQKRAQELEVQRDFYRNERNRLRHIMSQSPSMREYVESSPPSPVSSYSSLPYAPEGSIQQQQQQQQQPPPQQTQSLHSRPHLHQQAPQQQQQQHRPYPHQHTPTHTQPPMYPPMSTAPEYPSHPPGHHPTAAPESGGSSMERPAQRRRTDSGPNIEYYTPSYTTSAPPPHIQSSTLPSSLPSSLPPPLPPTGPSSRFHSMSPSPLSGSPNNPRLPPLRLDTPGSNPGSVGIGGGMATGPPTPEAGHGVSSLPVPHYPPGTTAPSAYSRSYDTAGWAADAPSPHPQHAPSDPKYQR